MINKACTLIHHFLEQSAQRYPEKTALIHEEVRATYSQINNQANQLAHWLIEKGVKKGDRVVFILENSLEYVISYYGTLKAGAVAVPLSTGLKPNGLEPLLAELEPKIIITSQRFERLVKACDQSLIKRSKLIYAKYPLPSVPDQMPHTLSPVPYALSPNSLASIIYTSGSTGKPKGVMLSHGNIVSNTHAISLSLGLTDKDIQMVVLPFFYVMGKSLLNTHFAVGGTVVLNNKFAFPAAVIKQMVDENVTGFSGVPSTYAYLLHRSPLEKYKEKLSSLRYCSQAGGHMSGQIKQDLRAVLPEHTKIHIMYGATEASARLTCLEPVLFKDKMDSIGKPIIGVTIRILDKKGNDIGAEQTGEIVASGPNIMQGYWKDEKATANVLDQNGYHTGDLGFKDKDGFYYVTGREDSQIKVGGHRINLQEIEDVLMETELLIEAVVLGIPDSLQGNRLMALVVTKNTDCSENLILSQCASMLPKFKLPGEIKKLKTLPKNTSGKIDRDKCSELIGTHQKRKR